MKPRPDFSVAIVPPPPCWGCGRTVALRFKRQRLLGFGGKARVAHKCDHGIPCIAGHRIMGVSGNNGPAAGGPCYCPQCFAMSRKLSALYKVAKP